MILSPINRTGLETIEKLSSTLDFTDYSSQIIHAVVEVLGNHDCYVIIIINKDRRIHQKQFTNEQHYKKSILKLSIGHY